MPAGFGYAMSSKPEKKQKASGWGNIRKQAAQGAPAAQVGDATLPASEPKLEPEPLKEESGGYMLPGPQRERVFVFQEGLRAGEQVLLLLGKKQGCQQNLRPDTGSLFLCFLSGEP